MASDNLRLLRLNLLYHDAQVGCAAQVQRPSRNTGIRPNVIVRNPGSFCWPNMSFLIHHSARRVLSQVVIGCGIALVCAYTLKIVGVELPAYEVLIACIIGIALVIAGAKLQRRRHIRRLQ
jgi:peptidoglycan/LPS O-acetylase OafA/YrhL